VTHAPAVCDKWAVLWFHPPVSIFSDRDQQAKKRVTASLSLTPASAVTDKPLVAGVKF
jgi:hypothetical protein